ncbi:putative tail sheath protein [Pseudomonas phage pPa_SNUABM_DT01]|nr:putative tail sheath protein [Pseudomonas phage pPa_SNUABM_DT01]
MSSVSMASSLPRTEVLGFKDVSGQGQPLEIVNLPIFLPWTPLFTSWGPSDTALLVSGAGFNTIYGADSFGAGSPFLSHQAAMLQKVLQTGAMSLVRRMKANGAKTATLRVWCDIVDDKIAQYERNPDGSFKRTDGQLVETGEPLDGNRIRWAVEEIGGEEGVRNASPTTGLMTNYDGKASTMYPFFDIEARFEGSKGKNFGLRLVAPTTNSSTPANAELVESQGAFLYRLSILERANQNSTGQVLMNLNGDPSVEFSLKTGVVDPKTNINYSYDKRILKAFENNDPEVFSGYGPLKTFYVYSQHVQTVLDQVFATEEEYGLIEGEVTPEQTINLFGGVNINGVPYYTVKVEGPAGNGVLFGETATHWLQGGDDGDVTREDYDQAVQDELNVFGEGDVPYADRASFPMSAFIDTGFSLETKKLMANVMAVRPDAWVLASTQDVNEPLNTPEEDSSIGAMLRNALSLVPESEFYNTGACRAVVMKHAGEYLDSPYDGILPFTVDFAVKVATYMGGERMRAGYAPDNSTYRVVTRFVNHNAKFRPVKPRNTDWQAGISSAEPFDHRGQVFFPGIQTVYHDNTSVLNSFFPMAICCHLNRIGELAWRMFTGDSRMTADEYAVNVDRFIEGQIKDRYDGRADITPSSYYTAADTQRGYSWHTDIEGLFDGMKTVEVLTIVAGRRTSGAETA